MKTRIQGKFIAIPACRPVDISGFEALVDHPFFQRLRGRTQLGVNYLVFPGAVHSRFEHSIGVLGLTQRVCEIQKIGADSRRRLCAYALLHDIGHGPFSHQIEPILAGDHHSHGLELLNQMPDALQACGVDSGAVAAMLDERDPLCGFVSDRNLGTDKLDYLQRDALHVGFSGVPDIEELLLFTMMDGGVPAVEEKYIEEIKRVQKFYSYLHQHGYLNKTALAVQRIFQRAVQEALSDQVFASGSLWDMTDADLMGRLLGGSSPRAKRLAGLLQTRAFHRSVLVIKPDGYGFAERVSGKPIHVLEWSRQNIRRFTQSYSDCAAVSELEDELARSLGLEPGDILLAAMPYFRKLIPKDVRIFSQSQGGTFWLFEKDPHHLKSLESDYLRTSAIRLVVLPQHRERVYRQRDRIAEFLAAKV